MDSTQDTVTESTGTPASSVTEKRVREVVVNYRGRRMDSVLIDSPTTVANLIRKVLDDAIVTESISSNRRPRQRWNGCVTVKNCFA